jgi:transcription antitermination factor NusG
LTITKTVYIFIGFINLFQNPFSKWNGGFCPKNMGDKFVFCIFCKASQESKVETFLQSIGNNVITALVERNIVKNGKLVKEFRSIIPGYVFFENDFEPDWNEICKFKNIYYPLQYSDNKKILRDKDLHFVKWLKGNNGKINISKAMEIGNKIKIMEGPLKELEGQIVKINKKQKCAGIKLEGDGIKNTIWLSYELIT